MNEEYNTLGKSLLFFYTSRIGIAGVVYFTLLVFICGFTSILKVFPDQTNQSKYDRMADVISISSSTLSSIASMVRTTIIENNSNFTTNYCTSNQSYGDCQAFLFQTLDNQMIFQTYGIFTSYTCTKGACQRVASLYDYLWTFQVRLPFINHLIIEYNFNGSGVEQLVVPACSNLTVPLINKNQTWLLSSDNSFLTLSTVDSDQALELSIALGYSIQVLRDQYQIQLSDYRINPKSVNGGEIVYSLEGLNLFSYSPLQQYFVIYLWLYTLAILLISLLFSILMVYLLQKFTAEWEVEIFKQLQSLDNLYKYQINMMFEGQQPKKSVILSDTAMTHFFENLSEIIDKDCQPLVATIPPIQKEETFKFISLIDRVMVKFQESLKTLEEERTHQFSNLKPLMRTSINDISEKVKQKLKDLYGKSRQMRMSAQFFYFGYLSILLSTRDYDTLLGAQKTPLPNAMVTLFRYMNHTINSTDIKFAFKFAFAYNQIIEQQIIMKIQDSLLQKYLISLKDLDVGETNYANKLGLKKRILNLQKMIDNKRHIFSVYLK